MKVLLIPVRRDFAKFLPLGVAYLAAFLEREGYNVKVYDESPNSQPLRNFLEEFKPDIVGISCMTSTYEKSRQFAKEVKKYNSQISVVFGGIHPTSTSEQTLKDEFVDFVIVGEGELTFSDLLKELKGGKHFSGLKGLAFKKDGKIIINERRELIQDLDSIAMPARHLFDMEYYVQRWNWPRGHWLKTANMMSSRGCPYSCIFCASKVMFGQTFRASSVKRTVDEVEHLVKDYGFECVSFSDDTFAVDKQRAIEIAREIKRRNLNVLTRYQLRANTCDEDLIIELKQAGCIQVDIGVESGSDRVLKILEKGITSEQIRKAFSVLKKHGVKSSATFIIGIPGETMEDIDMSRKLAEEINSDYTQFFILTPYPGTPLYNFAKENNLFLNCQSFDDFRHGGTELAPMLKVNFAPEQLIELRDKLNNQFVNESITNFLELPHFIEDLCQDFIEDPEKFKEYTRILKEKGSVGEALKAIMPHKL